MKGKTRPLAIRKHLVSVYIMRGYDAAKPLAIKYGVPPRKISQIAVAILGHPRTIFYSRSPFVECEAYRFDPRFAPIMVSGNGEAVAA